jgi:hypothetical protein
MRITYKMLSVALLAAAGCSDSDADNGVFPDARVDAAVPIADAPVSVPDAAPAVASFVYVETNDPAGNGILGFVPQGDTLSAMGAAVPTGGIGLNAGADQHVGPLDSDRQFALSADRKTMYAVNSGDRTMTIFGIASNGRITKATGPLFDTGGINPVSANLAGTHSIAVNKEVAGTITPSYATFDTKSQRPQAKATAPIGASPSVAYVSRDGKLLFGTRFFDGSRASQAPAAQIDSFVINASTGALTAAPGSPYALPADTSGISPTPVAVALNMVEHPTMDIVYVGFPTRNQIGVYTLNRATGALTFVRAVASSGAYPGWFLIDRTATHLYAVNSGSATISTFDLSNPLTPTETSSFTLQNATGPSFVDANGVTQTITSQPFQLAFGPGEARIYVVSQRVTTNTIATDPNGNYLHTLVIGTNGVLTEPQAPRDLRELGVPATARPQGVLVVTMP